MTAAILGGTFVAVTLAGGAFTGGTLGAFTGLALAAMTFIAMTLTAGTLATLAARLAAAA